MKAALYLRISLDQAGKSLGVTRQQEDCADLARALGWNIVATYTDNDVSATSGKARPQYQAMLTAMDAGEVEAVVAWHPDRLYRKVRDLGNLIDVCKRNNVQIATVKAGTIDLTTPTGRLVAGLLAQVATYEGEAKADRWTRSWRQQRELGTPPRTGSRMFGYTRESELIEDEAKIARRMAADIIAGVPILGVARWLEEEGITTTRGTVWRPGSLRQYLNNPRLAGHSTMGGEILGEGKWEPILDRDTWETVRALLSSRARGTRPRASLLNGLLFCGTCGHRMITSGTRGQRTYRCPNRPGMPGCGGVSGYAEPIETIVESYAQARLDDPQTRDALARVAASGTPAALAEIADMQDRIVELEAQLDEPGIPVATILRAIDRSRERLEEAQRRLTITAPVALPTSGGEWPADLDRRRRLIDLVVERVTLDSATKRLKYFDVERVKVFPR